MPYPSGYDYADTNVNPIKGTGITTEHACAVVVIGALAFLILIKKGFHGVNVGGLSVGIH